MWVASINPIERYTVAIANFHGHTDSYAPAALFKRIVEISFHTNLSAEFGLRQLKRLAVFKWPRAFVFSRHMHIDAIRILRRHGRWGVWQVLFDGRCPRYGQIVHWFYSRR